MGAVCHHSTDARSPDPGRSRTGSFRSQHALSRLRFPCSGRLAQLGERLPYKQEVRGSSPRPPIEKGPGNRALPLAGPAAPNTADPNSNAVSQHPPARGASPGATTRTTRPRTTLRTQLAPTKRRGAASPRARAPHQRTGTTNAAARAATCGSTQHPRASRPARSRRSSSAASRSKPPCGRFSLTRRWQVHRPRFLGSR
jgi:hypothetical protein